MKLTFDNAKYGQMIRHTDPITGAYIDTMKVWFFNKKGVFVGNIYRFVPYDQCEKRPDGNVWQRNYGLLFKIMCEIITFLIRKTQIINDND